MLNRSNFQVALEMPPENCTSALQGAMDVGEILVGSCAVLLGVCCWANVADVSCLMHHSFLGNLREIHGN